MWWNFINTCSTFTHSFTQFFSCFSGSQGVGRCALLILGKDKQLNNCFWKIGLALKKAGWCDLMQADLLIWADFANWTGWEVLTVLDKWKMALVVMIVFHSHILCMPFIV